MPRGVVVVDGSNIATEGRSEPSLAQLDQAVTAFASEHDFGNVIVVVDASFEHRVATDEARAARQAIDDGDIITPPAGAIGRGDAFILEIAERANAVVLSNDSFQEFHGTHRWLFDEDRLVGGKPVPGVGWIFVARTPVRGPVSRKAVRTSERDRDRTDGEEPKPAPSRSGRRATPRPKSSAATTPPTASGSRKSTRRQAAEKPATTSPELANAARAFETFRRNHPVGSMVTATVERFSSHGAYATTGDLVAYLPLRLLADPPPKKARDVVGRGDTRRFVVHEFHPDRRGIDLGIIGPAGATPELPTKVTANKTTAKKTTAKKTTTKKTPAKKTPAKKTPAKKTMKRATTKKTPAKKTTTKKTPAKKTTTKKTTAKKTMKRATTRKAVKRPATRQR
ncbi:MAG: hypothetical protein ACE5GB_05905 [Acidimicrobiales bacterium]